MREQIENDVETFMLKKAEEMGFDFYKFVSPGHKGVPDRIVVGHGYTFFVELKRSEDEEPRSSQKHTTKVPLPMSSAPKSRLLTFLQR